MSTLDDYLAMFDGDPPEAVTAALWSAIADRLRDSDLPDLAEHADMIAWHHDRLQRGWISDEYTNRTSVLTPEEYEAWLDVLASGETRPEDP